MQYSGLGMEKILFTRKTPFEWVWGSDRARTFWGRAMSMLYRRQIFGRVVFPRWKRVRAEEGARPSFEKFGVGLFTCFGENAHDVVRIRVDHVRLSTDHLKSLGEFYLVGFDDLRGSRAVEHQTHDGAIPYRELTSTNVETCPPREQSSLLLRINLEKTILRFSRIFSA